MGFSKPFLIWSRFNQRTYGVRSGCSFSFSFSFPLWFGYVGLEYERASDIRCNSCLGVLSFTSFSTNGSSRGLEG